MITYSNIFATIKYEYKDGRIVEVDQPFYSVDYSSVTGKDITIYSDEDTTTPIASIARDTRVDVIGFSCKRDRVMLIRTQSGLIGWHKLELWSESSGGGMPETFFSIGGNVGYRP